MSHNPDSTRRHGAAMDGLGRTVYLGAVCLVAWGVLAFGSPYPWAYVPLAVGSALVGLATWFDTAPPNPFAADQRHLLIALGVVMLAGIVQLIPLPARVVDAVSPANAAILGRIDLVFASLSTSVDAAAQVALPHRPLSIDPESTVR